MKKQWVTEGFDAFRAGTFGNGGQNLYVSKKGVLQRIYQYDLTGNGYLDLVFANCQNHHESAEVYVYSDFFGSCPRRSELPAQGAVSGAAVDLTGSGFVDLVVANRYDMAAPFASSEIYFGGTDDYGEKRHIRIPTPWSESCCAGRFRGGRHPALAFSLPFYRVVRIFYSTELGIEWSNYVDLPLQTGQMTAADLDGDGFDELIVLRNDSVKNIIYWGGPDGIDPQRFSVIEPALAGGEVIVGYDDSNVASRLEHKLQSPPLPRVVTLGGRNCLTVFTPGRVLFYGMTADRRMELVLELNVAEARAVATGDIRGDGSTAIFVAAHDRQGEAEQQYSYLYFEHDGQYRESERIAVPTLQACDAVMADFNGDGRADLAICQSHTEYSYTNAVLVYAGTPGGLCETPVRLPCEDAQRIFALPRPDGVALAVINHYSRSAVGFDKTYIYPGSADGYSPDRRIEVPSWCAVDSIMADLNDDGRPELVVCNNSENSLHLDPGSHIHFFNGNGEFEPAKSYLLPTRLGWGGVAGDFRRSGYLDLAFVCDHYKNLVIFHGSDGPYGEANSSRIILEREAGSKVGSPRWINAADLNGNGWLDLIVPIINGDRTLILWGGPEGFSMKRRTELAVRHGACARVADLTRNGYPDLIIGTHTDTPVSGELSPHQPHHSFIHIYWNGPDGLRENNKTILRADACDALCVADFNGDGWLDIFACSYHGGVDRDIHSFLYWNRQGEFKAADRQLIYTHSASGCLAADFNEDGFVDLAVANHKVNGDHLGFSSVWYNGPEGFDKRRRTDLPTAGPHGMTALEPGNALTRGPEEYYESAPFELPLGAVLRKACWEGTIPAKCWVKIQFRVAASKDGLVRTAWSRPFGCDEALPPELSAAGCWAQYRLELGAFNSLRSPRVTRVAVEYAV